ncbi:FIST signal transduction protein [Hirschia litorea]|uniref:FIST signal transduction protein n=1 Tax=Hirschia litorea TaxID=1199156 RepID=A0ABW2IKA6_9PROT
MKNEYIFSENPSTADALNELRLKLSQSSRNAQLAFAFYGFEHDADLIRSSLGEMLGDAAILGGSSHNGVMDSAAVRGSNSLGVYLIEDDTGDYGVGAAEYGDDPAAAAEAALKQALERADCLDQLPELVWVYQAPGFEDQVLEGLNRVVGERCPIVGGSAADNDVSGKWSLFDNEMTMQNGVVVAVFFPSTAIGFAYQGGYEPNGHVGYVTRIEEQNKGQMGRVTRVAGAEPRSRAILEINNRPAAEVYNEWTNGAISDKLEAGGVILSETNLAPIATLAGCSDGIDQYLLIHPESVREDGGLTTFASIDLNAELYCMRGDPNQIIERAGRVVKLAKDQLYGAEPAGAIMVFCGGCRMAVGEHLSAAPGVVQEWIGDAPLISCFTFGEQGPMMGKNSHGNLMISAIVFEA